MIITKITRFEIINHTGGDISFGNKNMNDGQIVLTEGMVWLFPHFNYNKYDMEVEFQDNGKTLKLFITKKDKHES